MRKYFRIGADVEDSGGSQSWIVPASNMDDAINKYNSGSNDVRFESDESEVTRMGYPYGLEEASKLEYDTCEMDAGVEQHSARIAELKAENEALKSIIHDTDMGSIACIDCKAHDYCIKNKTVDNTCADMRIGFVIESTK